MYVIRDGHARILNVPLGQVEATHSTIIVSIFCVARAFTASTVASHKVRVPLGPHSEAS